MSYSINYTDSTNKGEIVVEDNTINNETTIAFPGRYTSSYGQVISENFLHLLENFANDTSPTRPVEGQLWYDTSIGVDQLKVYDGTTWTSAGGLKKSKLQPEVSNSAAGDLWVNTDRQQLYMFTGSSWILIGPSYSDGLLSGLEAETVVSIENISYVILSLKVENVPLIIISPDAFVPKVTINGFRSGIKAGVNLSTLTINNQSLKYNGIAEKAENLIVGSDVVPSGNFLRSDKISTTNYELRIKNNNGIYVGNNNQLSTSIDGEIGVIQHNTSGSKIDFRLRSAGIIKTILTVDSNQRVGINNPAPNESLDVYGNVIISPKNDEPGSGILEVFSTADSNDISSGSIITSGGLAVALNTTLGGNLNVLGSTVTTNIQPDLAAERIIGSSENKFAQVHATTFFGNLQGNVTGSVSGRAGSADKLTSVTTFSIAGDVSPSSFEFDGQTGGSNKSFNIKIANSFISNKDSISNADDSDEIILNAITGETGVYKISKRNFLKSLRLTPAGVILPYGGSTPPEGWLFCNGAEISKTEYNILWATIGHSFKDPSLISDFGVNLFALPDMRGRFPLGLDNLGNTSANRITDFQANTLGGAAGANSKTIQTSNLPEHTHSLEDITGSQYYAVKVGAGEPVDDEVLQLPFESGAGGSHGLTTSGKVKADVVGQPVDIMNPYLALSYIIYTGL